MKKTRLSYDQWDSVILDKQFKVKFINNESFKGYVSEIKMLEVSKPQIWQFNGEDIVICKNDYKWLCILPDNENFCITAMLDDENCILAWYIDMIATQGVDEDNIPYFYDLYLDLIIYPNGMILEDDRDELEEVLRKHDITPQQFELANHTCETLKKGLLSEISTLIEYTVQCRKYLY